MLLEAYRVDTEGQRRERPTIRNGAHKYRVEHSPDPKNACLLFIECANLLMRMQTAERQAAPSVPLNMPEPDLLSGQLDDVDKTARLVLWISPHLCAVQSGHCLQSRGI
jgi:hypothetical protein